MKLEAYLGPDKPETLAVGEVEGGDAVTPLPRYGVVKQNRQTQEVTWVGAYTYYGTAMSRLNTATTHLHFGILTLLREQGLAEKVAATNVQQGVLDRVSN